MLSLDRKIFEKVTASERSAARVLSFGSLKGAEPKDPEDAYCVSAASRRSHECSALPDYSPEDPRSRSLTFARSPRDLQRVLHASVRDEMSTGRVKLVLTHPLSGNFVNG